MLARISRSGARAAHDFQIVRLRQHPIVAKRANSSAVGRWICAELTNEFLSDFAGGAAHQHQHALLPFIEEVDQLRRRGALSMRYRLRRGAFAGGPIESRSTNGHSSLVTA